MILSNCEIQIYQDSEVFSCIIERSMPLQPQLLGTFIELLELPQSHKGERDLVCLQRNVAKPPTSDVIHQGRYNGQM